jgi:hypothetical protein
MVSGVYTHIPKVTHIRTPPFSFAVNTTVRLVKKKRKKELDSVRRKTEWRENSLG